MSVLEKKAIAFEKLAAIKDEAEIDEILQYLESLNKKNEEIDLSKNIESISQRYDSTLRRLAQ
ncbi:hypothetical protein ACTJIJ_03035 [Niabella sp. 22666]|jgi:hypothetical protein|uniref:Uncharacterized protein n=1 Tax=Niabella yanshanensis TaxID=577386 RepID=A0ABZ0W374_9BACT|nr:hypothetical protein [Niabella yanshanensis]WQD37174.1 hypothetical protein U0035_16000 [Niabella yanshanensis]